MNFFQEFGLFLGKIIFFSSADLKPRPHFPFCAIFCKMIVL